MTRKTTIALLYCLLVCAACKDKYVARTTYPHTGYLVVEGFINAAGAPTRIRLSRSSTLDSASFRPELSASITVESTDNQSYPLYETGGGRYEAPVPVNAAQQYRLRIESGTREYLSDFVPPRITPPIDSVHWQEASDGVQIGVSSHDPAAQTIYYKWGFSETWKYTSRYRSNLIFKDDSLLNRPDDAQFYVCWKTDTPSTILLASTAKLAQDLVFNAPVTKIFYNEYFNKLYSRYSILVTESALTKEEYEWYGILKKNTESLGSIFDAQPSEISGNIHCLSDSLEPVIGFVGCRTETTQRIFISRTQLHVDYLSSGYESCARDSIYKLDAPTLRHIFGPQGYDVPIDYIYLKGNLVGYTGSDYDCADCRLKGGVLERPDFWID